MSQTAPTIPDASTDSPAETRTRRPESKKRPSRSPQGKPSARSNGRRTDAPTRRADLTKQARYARGEDVIRKLGSGSLEREVALKVIELYPKVAAPKPGRNRADNAVSRVYEILEIDERYAWLHPAIDLIVAGVNAGRLALHNGLEKLQQEQHFQPKRPDVQRPKSQHRTTRRSSVVEAA